jgi:four helix bundle protein
MTPQELKARTKKFAVDVIRFARTGVPGDPISADTAAQLTDAAGSTAAGYRATCRARSRADFVYKLGNTIEEVDEAALWLEVLIESETVAETAARPLWQEADELTRILVRLRETARKPR